MADQFGRSVLRVAVAQICQNIGWNAVQTTPMDILVDTLQRYVVEVGRTAHRYSEQYGRTDPNLDDFGLAFKDIGISVNELEEYVNNVEPVPFVHDVSKFPVKRNSNLQFPKHNSREVRTRPECYDDHMPLLYPDADDDDYSASPSTMVDGILRKDIDMNGNEGLLADGSRVNLKRPLDIEALMQTPKRYRSYTEDEGRPMREVTCVTMTAAGVISPMREGKLPEARTPVKHADDSRPSTPDSPNPAELQQPIIEIKKEVKKDSKKEEKKSKDKKDKGKELGKKLVKKEKDKKENKENKKKMKEKLKSKIFIKNVKGVTVAKAGSSKSSAEKSGARLLVKAKLPKIKPSKLKQNKLKPFLTKSKLKSHDLTKLSKAKQRKKIKTTVGGPSTSTFVATKSPKGKSPKPKTPKIDPLMSPFNPLDQLATICTKPFLDRDSLELSPRRDDGDDTGDESVKRGGVVGRLSGEDSPQRLVIDDNPETIERHERENRMHAMNDSINAAIERGLKESKLEQVELHKSYDETIEDVVRQSTDPHVLMMSGSKLEPRDVYDFTDDESSPPATPATPRTPEVPVTSSPPKKKLKKESPESGGKKVKDKIKEKIKQKSKGGKGKSPLAKLSKLEQLDEFDNTETTPKTPEPVLTSSGQNSPVSFQSTYPKMSGFGQYSGQSSPQFPYFAPIPQLPPALMPYPPSGLPPMPPNQFQLHTPPNMPMPPMGFYVRNPKPEPSPTGSTGFPMSPLTPTPQFPPTQGGLEKLEDTSSLHQRPPLTPTPSKPRKSDSTSEKVKSKEHKKEKKPKEKGKDKGKDKDKDKESSRDDEGKTKKKKDKTKLKDKKKLSIMGDEVSIVEKSKPKGKDKAGKASKEKGKEEKKGKGERKEKKKKIEDKIKEEKESSSSPSSSTSIPKITLKLGSTAASEGTKIFIKPPVPPPEDSPSSRSFSPPKVSTAPPPVPTTKAHPKPQSKVNPVPASSKAPPVVSGGAAGMGAASVAPSTAVSASHGGPGGGGGSAAGGGGGAAPARTVITETVGTIIDSSGNKIWICPACSRPDDGSPMIGCDECDDWYHWVCVGIVVPPKEEENWFCNRCIAKKQNVQKKRKKKHRNKP